MSWQLETIEIFRVLINDLEDTPKYSDERLERILLVAAFQVNEKADFLNDYTVDIQTTTLSPDPTSDDYRDDSFVNLMCLKAACLMERGLAAKAANLALLGREGFSSVDLRGVAEAKQKMLEKGGFCATFNDELLSYQMGSAQVAGAAILGPFRTIANYNNY